MNHDGVEQGWVFVVRVMNKPGSLMAIAAVFSNRGVSLEGVLGSSMTPATATDGRLILRFHATEHRKDILLRVLQRLDKVISVDAYAESDARVTAIAIAKVTPDSAVPDCVAVQAERVSQADDHQTILLTGNTQSIDGIIEQLRQQGLLLDVVISAIAV